MGIFTWNLPVELCESCEWRVDSPYRSEHSGRCKYYVQNNCRSSFDWYTIDKVK